MKRLVATLVRETRKGGVPTSRELATSETFFDDLARRATSARRTFRAKFSETKREIERELGPAEEHEADPENIVASWTKGGTTVRLTLAHEDKEMPFVLTLSAEHGAPLLEEATAPALCECATMTTTQDPFMRLDLFLVKNNPAIKKTHVRLAETKVEDTIVRLFQCRGCKRFRQSGDAGLQYVFEVPPIDVEEWRREPYVDYHRWKMYEASLARYLKDAARPTTKTRCRVRGCKNGTLEGSIACLEHHQNGRPRPPPGRALP